jgi:two-component system response regulator NreC
VTKARTAARIRILLADDHATVRDALTLLLNGEPDMEVVATAGTGLEALRAVPGVRPDVVVLDVSMPEMNGAAVAVELRRTCPDTALVALTRHADDAYVQTLLKAGVSAYVLKQSPSSELMIAIRAAVGGQQYLDPALRDAHLRLGRGRALGEQPGKGLLSAREEQVLKRVAWGYSNKEIAAEFGISVKTVEIHKANATRRLGLGSRIDIVRFALLQGWLRES